MDDDQKQRVMIAIVAFNFTVIALMLVFTMMGVFAAISPWSALIKRAAVSIVAGVVVGGLAYVAVQMSQR
jgi:hypothetical protein